MDHHHDGGRGLLKRDRVHGRRRIQALLNRSVLVSSTTVIIIMLLRRASDLRKALGVRRRTQNLGPTGGKEQSWSLASSAGIDLARGVSAWILSPLARSGTGGLSIAKHCTNFPQSSFH